MNTKLPWRALLNKSTYYFERVKTYSIYFRITYKYSTSRKDDLVIDIYKF